jgi:hypothetical protein
MHTDVQGCVNKEKRSAGGSNSTLLLKLGCSNTNRLIIGRVVMDGSVRM